VQIVSAVRQGPALVVDVQVDNKTGHKLPTGYPSRRAFLHLTVKDGAGAVVFESGATDEYGRLVDGRGGLIDAPGVLHPHRDQITADDQVQIYEAVPGDGAGQIATSVVEAQRYLKDDRLLPIGYQRSGPSAALTASVGVDQDANFGSSDHVTYRVPVGTGALSVAVELAYQSVRPTDLEALASQPTPAGRRLFDMVTARAPRPVSIASTRADVP
jgi:hypothetical protein